MCIFQLPAITGLRTLNSSAAEVGANLRRCARSNLEAGLLSPKRDLITRLQSLSPSGFDAAIDHHLTGLDALFGLTATAHPPLPFEELIQFHGDTCSLSALIVLRDAATL